MAQIIRVFKSDISMLVRYENQRHQHNYYKVLRVTPNATQKEIKQAFLKLSKQTHPDIKGPESHIDFVKINEAYSVLSKADTRRLYDKRNHFNDIFSKKGPSQYYYHEPTGVYMSRKDWEANMGVGPKVYTYKPGNSKRGLLLCFLIIFFGSVAQILFIKYFTIHKSRRILEKYAKYERDYEKSRSEVRKLTPDEQIKRIMEFQELLNRPKPND